MSDLFGGCNRILFGGSVERGLADATTANRRAPAMRRAMPTLLLISIKDVADALK